MNFSKWRSKSKSLRIGKKIFLAIIAEKPCTSRNRTYYIETQDFLLVLFFDAFLPDLDDI